MARPKPVLKKHVGLYPTDPCCPHCGGTISLTKFTGADFQERRCVKCRCRWSGSGQLMHFGSQCPWLVKT